MHQNKRTADTLRSSTIYPHLLHHFAFLQLLVESHDVQRPFRSALRFFAESRRRRRETCCLVALLNVGVGVLVVRLHTFQCWI